MKLKTIAGRAAMALSLIGMISMSVSAAGETELDQISSNINITEFVANLNANGRIEYDREEDGKPEVYYDFKDYQVLGDSLNTINKNEQALSEEYTRLYNLAENNRKTLISSWNKLGLLPIGEDAKYVTGDGTASLRGAMEALGTAPAGTQPASEGDLLAGKSALVPGKGWIKGNMSKHSFNEISINADWVNKAPSVSTAYPNPKDSFYSGGEIDTASVTTALQKAYGDGIKDGKREHEEQVLSLITEETVTYSEKCPNTGKQWYDRGFGTPDGYHTGDGKQWYHIKCNECGELLNVEATNADIAKEKVSGNPHGRKTVTKKVKIYNG